MQTTLKRPQWLNKKISLNDYTGLENLFSDLKLSTVCQQALCPNISECFARREATFLILGKVCTRNCLFCAIKKGMPLDINEDEPENVGEAVRRLGLKHIVITSVTRDDLFDGGAGVFAKTIASIRKNASPVIIEVLIPDFKGRAEFIKTVVDACPKIISHNLETVPSLYNKVRPMADYRISLDVLRMAKQLGETKEIYTKSAIMLGLGETEEEVISLFYDLRSVRCDFLSIGQYLAPSKNHFPVKSFIAPEKFDEYKDIALKVGFLYVASGPYVRSSYLASEYISKKDEVMV